MIVVRAQVEHLAHVVETRDPLAEKRRRLRDPELGGLLPRRQARLDLLPDQAARRGSPPERLAAAPRRLGLAELPGTGDGREVLEDRARLAVDRAKAADLQQLVADAEPGPPRQFHVDDDPDLRQDPGVGDGLDAQNLGAQRPAGAEPGDPGVLGDDGADALHSTDQRELGEMVGGAPQGLARDAELRAELGLARQHLAGPQPAGPKRCLEPVHHLHEARQGAVPVDRVKHHV